MQIHNEDTVRVRASDSFAKRAQEKKEHEKEEVLVMAFGTFDYFHAGHDFYLKQAKSLGDYLLVVVARDRTVRQIKGAAPSINERKRMKLIKKSGIADKVILGSNFDKYKVIKKYRPNIIALGYDQFAFTQKLKKIIIDYKLDTKIKRIDAFFPQVYKSSLLKRAEQEQHIVNSPLPEIKWTEKC